MPPTDDFARQLTYFGGPVGFFAIIALMTVLAHVVLRHTSCYRAAWLPFRTVGQLTDERLCARVGEQLGHAVAAHTMRSMRVSMGISGAAATCAAVLLGLQWGSVEAWIVVGVLAIWLTLAATSATNFWIGQQELRIADALWRPDQVTNRQARRLLEAHWPALPGALLVSPVHEQTWQLLLGHVDGDTRAAAAALADGWEGTLGELLEVAEAVATIEPKPVGAR